MALQMDGDLVLKGDGKVALGQHFFGGIMNYQNKSNHPVSHPTTTHEFSHPIQTDTELTTKTFWVTLCCALSQNLPWCSYNTGILHDGHAGFD